jgi:hypothetical protein
MTPALIVLSPAHNDPMQRRHATPEKASREPQEPENDPRQTVGREDPRGAVAAVESLVADVERCELLFSIDGPAVAVVRKLAGLVDRLPSDGSITAAQANAVKQYREAVAELVAAWSRRQQLRNLDDEDEEWDNDDDDGAEAEEEGLVVGVASHLTVAATR